MREIKFRCWNSFASYMESWETIVKMNKIHLLAKQQQSYTIMQFTGLKDKNGVEIYEGDIINPRRGCFVTGDVIFWNGSFWINGKNKRGSIGRDIISSIGDCEVIGNIHQNPELLK